MNHKPTLLTALGTCFLVGVVSTASSQVIFMETFDNTNDQVSISTLDDWNWAVSDGDGSDTSNRQFARLSGLNGVDGEPGFVYTFSGVGERASVAWFDGLSFTQSEVTGFSAQVGHGNSANEVRFLIQIDNANWYVSTDAGMANIGGASNFETDAVLFEIGFSTAGENWVQLNYDGLVGTDSSGFDVLSGDLSGSALTDPLPSGDITAVGAYLYNDGGSTRFDDLTVIPEPSAYAALFGLTALALVGFLRRRK